MRRVGEEWSRATLDPAEQPKEAADAFDLAVTDAQAIEAIAQPSLAEQARQEFLLAIPEGAGNVVGATAATAGLGFLGALAVAVSRTPGADAIVLWWAHAAPNLRDIYTYVVAKRDASED
jgi:hypothetical protein